MLLSDTLCSMIRCVTAAQELRLDRAIARKTAVAAMIVYTMTTELVTVDPGAAARSATEAIPNEERDTKVAVIRPRLRAWCSRNVDAASVTSIVP